MIALIAKVRFYILNLLHSKDFFRNVAILAGGTALGQGIAVLASPLLTRLYTPDDIGVLGAYVSMISLVAVVGSWRYEQAVPLPQKDSTAANVLALCLIIVLIMTTMTGLVVWGMGNSIVRWANAPLLRPYLWLLPFSILGVGIYQALSYWAVRKKAFRYLAQTKLSQSVGQILPQVILGFTRIGTVGLLIGDVIGRVSGSGTLTRLIWKQDRKALGNISLLGMRQVAYRYRRFPFLSSGSALLNSIGQHFPTLLLTSFYGTQVAGWFTLSQRTMGLPLSLLAVSVAKVYLGESASITKTDLEGQLGLFWQTARRLSLVGGILVLVVGGLAPWIFRIIFGDEWVESARYIRVFMPMYFLSFVGGPLWGTLDVLERQELHVLREVLRVCLMPGSLLLARRLQLGPYFSMITLSAGGSIFYIAGIFLVWHGITGALKQRQMQGNNGEDDDHKARV
jgi:O-antigen/teichoic acid export membrane protein